MVKQKLNMKPRISVIIPTKNRYSTLKKVLQALEKQDCSRYSFEVIVIDDLSTDETPGFLSDFAQRTTLTFSFFPGKGQSAGAARNIGLAKAKGDLVLFLDCDTIPNPDLVRRHLQFQNRLVKTIDCVMGQVRMDPDLEIPNQARLWETELQAANGNPSDVTWWHFRTANTSMKRAACDLVGGFDIRLEASEDTELAYRLSKRGVRFYYDASIMATHYHPMSLEEYLRKGEMYGRAIALWYHSSPELRRTLAWRYGVYAPEFSLVKKLKYFLRGVLVNRVTMHLILFLGKAIRTRWFSLSDRLYQCGYRYRTRKAFRETISKFSFSKKSSAMPLMPFESATIKH
jgi:glycosyltransferase involved in cell wall biosynthesis